MFLAPKVAVSPIGDCPLYEVKLWCPKGNLLAADHPARPQTVKLSKLRINIKIYAQQTLLEHIEQVGIG